MPIIRTYSVVDGRPVLRLPRRELDWSDVETLMPGKAALALDRVEVNGLDVFSRNHPFLGHLLGPGLEADTPPMPEPTPLPPLPPPSCVPTVVVPEVVPPGGVVPEPGTLGMVAVGLAVVLVLAWRRGWRA